MPPRRMSDEEKPGRRKMGVESENVPELDERSRRIRAMKLAPCWLVLDTMTHGDFQILLKPHLLQARS